MYSAAPAGLAKLKETIRAYHGSPHDFDRFDYSKIGTGEGAQAYGHGLYFADEEKVARNYRDQLRWRGANWDDPQTLAANAIDRAGGRAEAADTLQASLDSTNRFFAGKTLPASQAAANAKLQEAIATLRSNAQITGKPPIPGRMYEVSINADPAHMLDWDKALSQQTPYVQQALTRFGLNAQPQQVRAFDDALLEALTTNKNVEMPRQPFDPSGQDIYFGGRRTRGLGGYNDAVNASDRLRDAGIPGIRYLDQGSRASGVGTRNYVMFDDSLINIARKYAVPGMALPPGVAAYMQQQGQY
jgi:hypothetical protein